jgi:hypothetical protein
VIGAFFLGNGKDDVLLATAVMGAGDVYVTIMKKHTPFAASTNKRDSCVAVERFSQPLRGLHAIDAYHGVTLICV